MSSRCPERRAARALLAAALLASPLLAAACRGNETPNFEAAVNKAGAMEMRTLAAPSGTVATNLPAEDGQWTMAAKDYANTRYSGLAEISAASVKNLHVAWTWSTGNPYGHEGTPLVVGTTMYVVTPFPNELYALDVGAQGAIKWKYAPPFIPAAPGVSCCGHINRGPTYADGRVFFTTLDNQVVAVDAATGREAWRTTLGAIERGETMSMAPLVVKGKVIVGNSGGEFGARGWLTALDAATGKIAWRAYGTGSDKDVLIGPAFKPFYAKDQGKDLGATTWQPGGWKNGGATSWGWLSYDPELDLLYYGTGNAGPWNPDLRPGDNKWAATLFARDPDTGEARWAYQIWPHDRNDYDAINESVLLDLPVGGRPRKLLLRAEKNGYMYLFDRATGEVVAADSFAYSTVMHGVDLKTGAPRENPERWVRHGKVTREICPSVQGAKDHEPTAYSFRTGLVYVPGNNLCEDVEGTEANYIEGTPYLGAISRAYAGPGGHRGEFFAWDPVARRKVWSRRERFPLWGGALATAGDVVFYGTMDRWFRAVHARTGQLLWQFRTGAGIVAPPITFRGPDGKQYVAVMDGPGGWMAATVEAHADPADSTGSDGAVGASADLRQHTVRGGTLYVFGLP
ncbi:PQQ-dependent dehydrogenase, methanol/ethanol family [Roseisolibacter agri]|uniref:Methanol dehydrogenase n=1 Tax=Roseisolibacter agri TaxID=2014610 RepID=A0AA37QDT9_9BACT|nr:PQQ-dependent dehydrogenase, methanol/ethanol family [Roseisolibacter agri]GLC23918.1 methanol dehydrogenase [Roseisolibacter agri]